MLGLGLGSLVGGHWADRLSGRGRLAAFAGAQAAVGCYGVLSVWLHYDVLYMGLAPRLPSPAVAALVLFLTLLWPTFFMGASLPLLARSVTPGVSRAASRIGGLTALNTLGGAAGALAAVLLLARSLGLRTAVHVAAALNLVCVASVAVALARGAAREPEFREPSEDGPAPVAEHVLPFGAWAALYAAAGAVALSLEILWFRLLRALLQSDAFTFSILLALYLAGVGGGNLLGVVWARRTSRPAAAFLAVQSAVTLLAGLTAWMLVNLMTWRYAGGSTVPVAGPAAGPPAGPPAAGTGWLGELLPPALILPPTLLMGAAWPLLQKAVQTDLGHVGRRVGWLQAASILGSTIGAVVTGLVLLGRFGTSGTFRILVMFGGVFLALLAWTVRGPRRAARLTAALAVTAAVMGLVPGPTSLWAALHRTTPNRVLLGEDATGVVVLRETRPGVATLHVSGREQARLPYGGPNTLMGALPVLIHPQPRSVLVVGLASGDSLFASGARPETERLDCVEIVAPQLDLLRRFAARRPDPGLRALLGDARVRITTGDGRAFLMRETSRYDVIQAYAQLPDEAYSGNLYSVEYFSLIRSRLSRGGFAVSWDSTPRMLSTFRSVFPHVLVLGRVLVGSSDTIAYQEDDVRRRLADPRVRQYYRAAGVEIAGLLDPLLVHRPTVHGPPDQPLRPSDVNTDLYPRDEYQVR
jgi:spermidine synthase